jgi:ribosomal protein S13
MKNKIIEAFEPEYNPLSKNLKITLVLDEQALKVIQETASNKLSTEEDFMAQVLELLERSINLNLPSKINHRSGRPLGGSW